MINITFYQNTQKIDANKEAPIFMTLTFNGERIRRAVKNSKIKQSYWNTSKSRIKKGVVNAIGIPSELINAKLEELEENIKKINKEALREESIISKDYILARLENPHSIDARNIKFFQAFDEFLEVIKSYRAKNTIKNYNTVRNFLEDFQKSTKYKIELELIDFSFFEKLRSYAFLEREITDNYFVKIITVLKTFLTWCIDKKYCQPINFKNFKTTEREIEVIHLTLAELFRLYKHNFKSTRLEHVKDTFCFGCFTSLRIGDLRQLKENQIFDKCIIKNIQKTKEPGNKIPLNKFSRQIIEKYRSTIHNPLPLISDSKFNEYIKECCKEVGIDTLITIVEHRGPKSIEKVVPKHELITSHVARKTFATNSLILGMPERVVRSITGHKTEKSFRRYVKIAEDVKENQMGITWDQIELEKFI